MENDTIEVSVNPEFAKNVKKAATDAVVGVVVTLALTQLATYATHKAIAWRKARKARNAIETTATEQ